MALKKKKTKRVTAPRTVKKVKKVKSSTKAPKALAKLIRIPRVVDWEAPKKTTQPKRAEPKPDRRGKRGKGKPKALDVTSKERAILEHTFKQWKSGTSLADLARDLAKDGREVRRAVHGNPKQARIWLYNMWTKMQGGVEAMKKLRAAGAGARVAFGGHRALPRRKGEVMQPTMDDSKVARVTDMSKAAGWTFRRVRTPHRMEMVYIAPDGAEYVSAKTTERADLIRTNLGVGIPDGRLRLLATSNKMKAVRREEKLVAKGEKVRKAKLAMKKKVKAKAK